MAKLSDFTSDTKAISDGVWLRVNEAVYGDLEILSRGYTDEFVDAQNARLRRAADPYGGDRTQIPNAIWRTVNASLCRDILVLGVRNLKDDDGNEVTLDAFYDMLDHPKYQKLARAAMDAAARVTTASGEQLKVMTGNSIGASSGS